MFGFLNPGVRDAGDPMVSAKSAAAWLHELPSLDIVARQQLVLRAFDGMRQSRRPVDFARSQALQYADAALGADRRQLFKQYVDSLESAPKVSERIWQASLDLTQGFIGAYQTVLESALAPSAFGRWKVHVPILFARLIHYYGTDAKLRVCRHERWIPAKWVELHRAFMRASELGIERIPTSLGGDHGSGTQWTVEQEYVFVLLVHQLNSGNLSPANLDWAATQIRSWSRKLELVALPKTMEGFFVDLAGRGGLARRTGQDAGAMLRYLDTTPLAEQLDMTLAALRHSEETDQGPVGPLNQQRALILEKARAAVAPNLNTDMRRDPRTPCIIAARVRIGLSRIQHELNKPVNPEGAADSTIGSSEQIEVYAVAGPVRTKNQAPEEADTLSASLAAFPDPVWQVKDRSVAGLRIYAGSGVGHSLTLGALVAVRQSHQTAWVLGVVRRLNKLSTDEIEAGVSIIAERVVPVTLHAKREVKEGMGIVVNGFDTSMLGGRIDGLYLPPPSRPDKPLVVKTVIVPTQEYAEGRKVILMTGRSIYTVALRQLVEQRADWSWVAIQVLEKLGRG
jgi:cyclic-di-GMP-binding protein